MSSLLACECVTCGLDFEPYKELGVLRTEQCRKCWYAGRRDLDRRSRNGNDKASNKQEREWLY